MLIGAQIMGFSRGGCILDVLAAGVPPVAYSLRRTTASYGGKCINVRRSSDNTAIGVGFIGNGLDTVTLLAFCGSGSGYVTKWYNQGALGSSGDAAQSIAAYQPQIVASGVVETFKGLPSILFSGGQFLVTAGNVQVVNSGSGLWSGNIVASPASSSNMEVIGQDNGTTRVLVIDFSGNFGKASTFNTGSAANPVNNTTTANPQIVTAVVTSSLLSVYGNGGNVGTLSVSSLNTVPFIVSIGGQSTSAPSISYTGYLSEGALWGITLSTTDRQTLEHNQEAFYGISGS